MLKNKVFPSFVLLSLLIGFVFNEDSLGGGYHDYLYHEKYFFYFSNDFFNSLKNYGMDQVNEGVRNSPVFYMMFSLFLKMGFEIESLKFINLIIIVPIIFFFNKCINISYKNIPSNTKFYILSILLLSPTIRTLLIWPYPLLWALSFFIMAIYFYLNFEETSNSQKKIRLAYCNIFFVSLAAYFTPNFAIFSIYFFYKYYLNFGISKKILNIVLLNIFLALPAIYFFVLKDFYLLNSNVAKIDPLTKFNISNKIVIITSIFFLFFLPLIPKLKYLKTLIIKTNYLNLKFFFLLLFILVNIYFFNFLENSGGGIFFHLSYVLFENSIIMYVVFTISVLLFYILNLFNFNNILIFFLLILYNIQFEIYYKYFDPLMIFLILFFIKFSNYDFIKIELIAKKYAIFYVFFLTLSIAKMYIN